MAMDELGGIDILANIAGRQLSVEDIQDISTEQLEATFTKAAINNFTKGLAKQVIGQGIRVNAVAPGPVWTPLQPSHGQPEDAIPEFGTQAPIGRAGQPAEVAPAYVFLASQESSFVTAETIGVTGGQHLP
jgi:NAD(P)-dependent dehydrogenase (short-subunit alcohol dehydrogenase family)